MSSLSNYLQKLSVAPINWCAMTTRNAFQRNLFDLLREIATLTLLVFTGVLGIFGLEWVLSLFRPITQMIGVFAGGLLLLAWVLAFCIKIINKIWEEKPVAPNNSLEDYDPSEDYDPLKYPLDDTSSIM